MKPPIKQFDHLQIQLQAIKSATNNFSQENCIGKGGFGSVYKGELAHSTGQTMVAIKRLNREFGQGEPEFWKEIMTLSQYRNENIVSLLGFCDESEEKILVYEYMSRKSLDLYLSSNDLTWVRRLKICIGAARGLAYLHRPNDAHQRVLHRDIKSGNILLDEDWNARISDFGLSRFGPADQLHTFLISNPAGTIGYCDPLYVQAGLLTKESDVYSLGVVLFEVLCGRLCYPNGIYKQPLIELVRKFYDQNKIEEIVFDKIKDEINPSSLKTFATIAYRCLNLNREARPQMTEVVSTLETALYYQECIQSPPIPLRNISPGGADEPIEVRVVRKWIPSETEMQCCYLFVDRNGDAIQVIADLRDLEHFNAIITLQSCYRVTKYICDKYGYTQKKVVPHCAIIRIGKDATFLQIPDDGFPSNYFNFATYENLRARLTQRQLLTDYVGKVESTPDTPIQSNIDCLKIKLLQDPCGEVIEAILLGEVATSFDQDALMHASSPVIAALTSMEIVKSKGVLQLRSTSATQVYLDPNIEQAKAIAAKFQGENKAIELSMSGNKDNESERNRATLAELLKKEPKDHTGTRFTCIASITTIHKGRSWYYKGCTKCFIQLKPRGEDIMACRDHGNISEPRYMYCVNVTITDHTTSASAILYNEAMASLLQPECKNMVVDQGYQDPKVIPEPLLSIEGQTRIFQLELAKPRYPTSARFIINQVFQTTLPNTITPSTTPSSMLTRVKRKPLRSQDPDDDAAKKLKAKKNKRTVKRRKN